MSSPSLLIEPTGTPAWRPNQVILRWHWIVLGGLLGALAALLLSQVRPPRYEAAAQLGIGIDVPRTPPLDPLTEIRVLDRAAAVILSDQTLIRLQQDIFGSPSANPEWVDAARLRQSLRLDRMAGTWSLVGIAEDPEAAADLANAWLQVSVGELDGAMEHAWRALRFQSAPIVVACSELAHGSPVEFIWECLAAAPSPGPTAIAELRHEIALSRGVLPVLSYEPLQQAVPPSSPTVWDRGPLTGGAALCGIALGTLLASLWPVRGRRSSAASSAEQAERL